MMMKMLEAGGMEAIQDGIRTANDDNPGGYYEFERVKQIQKDDTFLTESQGKVIKILFNFLYDLPSTYRYKIIFMRRAMGEILASQNKMMERRGEKNDIPDAEMSMIFDMQIKKAKAWLAEQDNIEAIYVNYNDLLKNPVEVFAPVSELLEGTLDTDNALTIVDANLYRNRK